MFKGTYQPAAGRPQQNYNFVKVAIYYRNHDRRRSTSACTGSSTARSPPSTSPHPWYLHPKYAAVAFNDEVP